MHPLGKRCSFHITLYQVIAATLCEYLFLQQAFESTDYEEDTSPLGIAHPEAAATERSQNH